MDAFLYLQVRPGAVEDVVVQLENARGVRAAVAVIGDWDVLAALHAPSLNAIAEAVARDVHRIDGVLRTVTAPVVPGDVLGIAGGGLRRPGRCSVAARHASSTFERRLGPPRTWSTRSESSRTSPPSR